MKCIFFHASTKGINNSRFSDKKFSPFLLPKCTEARPGRPMITPTSRGHPYSPKKERAPTEVGALPKLQPKPITALGHPRV